MSSQEIKLRFKVENYLFRFNDGVIIFVIIETKFNQRGKILPVHVWVIKERKV